MHKRAAALQSSDRKGGVLVQVCGAACDPTAGAGSPHSIEPRDQVLSVHAPWSAGSAGAPASERVFRRITHDGAISASPALATSFSMSSRYQTVVRGPSFTGFGYFPLRTPSHQVERPIGINFTICLMRRNPPWPLGSISAFGMCDTSCAKRRECYEQKRTTGAKTGRAHPVLGSTSSVDCPLGGFRVVRRMLSGLVDCSTPIQSSGESVPPRSKGST
jgi:hypothetical protein